MELAHSPAVRWVEAAFAGAEDPISAHPPMERVGEVRGIAPVPHDFLQSPRRELRMEPFPPVEVASSVG